MKLRLTYKSYSGIGLNLIKGDTCDVSAEQGAGLLATGWFVEEASSKPKEAPAVAKRETKPFSPPSVKYK